jgi:Ca2+-binding RTX toxin-like protein
MGTFTGTHHNDTITPSAVSQGVKADPPGTMPSAAGDTIDGGAGNDTINGGAGDDEIFGGLRVAVMGDGVLTNVPGGDDSLIGGDGNDTIDGGDGDDIIFGGDASTFIGPFQQPVAAILKTPVVQQPVFQSPFKIDVLAGKNLVFDFKTFLLIRDNDELYGGEGNDVIYGEKGNDTIWGDPGNDTLFGGIGDDKIYGGDDSDLIYGGAGNDTLKAEEKEAKMITGNGDGVSDTIHGGDGDDEITGGDGDDVLNGDAGNDKIFGMFGENTINGGAGKDELFGFRSKNTYVFSSVDDSPFGNGDIVHFRSRYEKIDLSQIPGSPSSNNYIGSKAFTGGDGVVEVRLEQPKGLQRGQIQVDANDNGVFDAGDLEINNISIFGDYDLA